MAVKIPNKIENFQFLFVFGLKLLFLVVKLKFKFRYWIIFMILVINDVTDDLNSFTGMLYRKSTWLGTFNLNLNTKKLDKVGP